MRRGNCGNLTRSQSIECFLFISWEIDLYLTLFGIRRLRIYSRTWTTVLKIIDCTDSSLLMEQPCQRRLRINIHRRLIHLFGSERRTINERQYNKRSHKSGKCFMVSLVPQLPYPKAQRPYELYGTRPFNMFVINCSIRLNKIKT